MLAFLSVVFMKQTLREDCMSSWRPSTPVFADQPWILFILAIIAITLMYFSFEHRVQCPGIGIPIECPAIAVSSNTEAGI